jgi:putative SOS response-associated peptidase YedK
MCGRYVVTNPKSKTEKLVKSAIQIDDVENYNAHPLQKLPVIKKYKNGNTLENFKWGITPSWAKEKEFRPLINARLETIDEKISFKKLIKEFRCVAVADGFYEWQREEKEKIPYYFSREDQKTLFMAGIFDKNEFCLITEEASDNIKKIHHRQPVILNQSDVNRYLNLELSGSLFLKDCKKPKLSFHRIAKDVNKPSNNSISLIQKIN